MKTKHILPLALFVALLTGGRLHAQIFVTTGTGANNSEIQEYNTDGTPVGSGTLVDPAPDLEPGIAVSGSDILVADFYTRAVVEYTTAGAPVGPFVNSGTLIFPSQGLSGPSGIAISGSDIYVANRDNNTITEYTTAGASVPSGTFGSTRLANPVALAISGPDIFVTNYGNNTIGEYTTSGSTVNAALISTGLNRPLGIAISGSDIFVANFSGNSIGEYTTSGSTVNADLVSVFAPEGIAIVPEPSAWALLTLGGAGLLIFTSLRRRSLRSRAE